LIIFIALLWVCFQQGLLSFFKNHSPQGLLLAFIVTGFFGRSLVDSNIRDHMLEQFVFLLCVMLVFLWKGTRMNPEKILVIRRDNIGDLVCTTPLIHALRTRFPKARLDLLVNSYNAPLLVGHPDVDHLYVYTKAKHRENGECIGGLLETPASTAENASYPL
jgi:hypothetical protein